ncbi:DNA polymerase III subunit delta' [Lysobacter sp. A3-1-A15]|uniref:DNA polymerase III subunit delta' n=1 Tax=Novilysobacter viscosus TaxID=3098602 RepID=UPI002ED97EC8
MSARQPLAPWQQRIHDHAADALDAGRLGHGLLFCGPAQLGKRAVAERLAERVLCLQRSAGEGPCGRCRSCHLLAQRHQRDPVETRPDGQLAHPLGHSGHPDLVLVGHVLNEKGRPPKMRSEIVIEQVRNLSEKLALTTQYGGAQVVIIDPADAVNHAACNALLKTLEEPVPGRYLWLVSGNPARLPATIRSRCQRLEFRLPPREESLQWLQAQGHDSGDALEALEAAHGHPGQADAWLRNEGMGLRRQVGTDLDAIAQGTRTPLETAQRWTADEHAALRLRHAADLAVARAAERLTDPARTRSLAAWFDQANRTCELLRTTVRADLAVLELLMAWRSGAARSEARSRPDGAG